MSTILITGASGFIGPPLAAALLAQHPVRRLILTDLQPPPLPPASTHRGAEVVSVPADLTSPDAVQALCTPDLTHVYLLHGLMSGDTEANIDLGLRINIDATRSVLDTIRRNTAAAGTPPVVVVFASSCAVHSLPADQAEPIRDDTLPCPSGSYGAQKLMIEVLLADYARKGLLDGRAVRLPTVIVRPGKPSGAASSFVSGIFREPLAGVPAKLPVRRDLEVWVGSTGSVVKNLVRVLECDADAFGEGLLGLARTVNLPGTTVTVSEMLDALREVGGEEARALVKEEPDAVVQRIVYQWARRYETHRASRLGLKEDATLAEMIREYVEDYGGQ